MRLSDIVRAQAPRVPEGPSPQDRAESGRDWPAQSPASGGASSLGYVSAGADWYDPAQKEMTKVGALVRASRTVPLDRCLALAADIVKRLGASDDLVQSMMRGDVEDYQSANAVHVAILSVKIGMGLHYDPDALERLALAGLLHDLGMWLVPEGIAEKPEALNEEERARIHAHPEEGRRIIADMGEAYGWLAEAVAQEHERWDGSGYPCRLKGGEIVESAQIIGLADVIDALVSPRPYHARLVPHQALRALLVQHKQTFSPRLLKTVVDQLSLYPVGTSVRLNDGHVGVVSRINPRFPLRPVLLVRRTREGRTSGDAAPLDLSHETSVHIVEVLPAACAA
jgi:hypothetical protein